MSEHMLMSEPKHWLGLLNLKAIRQSCIEACLEAMIDERRFAYTDMYVKV